MTQDINEEEQKKDYKDMDKNEIKRELKKYTILLLIVILIAVFLNLYMNKSQTNKDNENVYNYENTSAQMTNNTNLLKNIEIDIPRENTEDDEVKDNEIEIDSPTKVNINENNINLEEKQEEDYHSKNLYNEFLEEQQIYQNYLDSKIKD